MAIKRGRTNTRTTPLRAHAHRIFFSYRVDFQALSGAIDDRSFGSRPLPVTICSFVSPSDKTDIVIYFIRYNIR